MGRRQGSQGKQALKAADKERKAGFERRDSPAEVTSLCFLGFAALVTAHNRPSSLLTLFSL